MITLIDNYDSFTYNLYHCLSKRDQVLVIKNDMILKNIDKIINSKGVVISPGPSNPFNWKPWSDKAKIIVRDDMKNIEVEDVMSLLEEIYP